MKKLFLYIFPYRILIQNWKCHKNYYIIPCKNSKAVLFFRANCAFWIFNIYISFKSIVYCLICYSLSLEFRQTFFFQSMLWNILSNLSHPTNATTYPMLLNYSKLNTKITAVQILEMFVIQRELKTQSIRLLPNLLPLYLHFKVVLMQS